MEDALEELNRTKQTNSDLAEMNIDLRHKLKAGEVDRVNLETKVKELEKYQLRFKKDLQACLSVTSESEAFADRIVSLEERYTDSDEETEKAFQHQVNCLKKKLETLQGAGRGTHVS